jgi:suppressor for copper-sensitivity B
VFAMALSLLGLWEIPIPGFIGGGVAMKAAEKEGPSAAFLKGVLTTLLATPCTGPFMATALAWAVKQPAWMTYSVFGVLGLGMASPYLLIGAFPELVRFLPRPGAWMESFKKIMGLVLLATVVWLMTFIDAPLAVPTVLMLVGIASACWWVSQTPITASAGQKFYAWTTAGLVVAISALGSYGWLYQSVMLPRFEKVVAAHAEQQMALQRLEIARSLRQIERLDQLDSVIELLAEENVDRPWQPFSLKKLGQLTLEEGRTVLVDFTADWCLTCKTLEKFVLKTPEVEEALTQADVVTMEADYTKYPPALDRAIKALGGVGVPLVAIFPATDPYHPIVFANGNYTKSQLIAAILQATGRDVSLSSSTEGNKAALTQAGEGEPLR